MSILSYDVEKIYQKDLNLKKEDINQLKEWLKKQPHLPKATEEQLIWFLHSCFYSIEKAKTTIDAFFTIRTIGLELSVVPDKKDISFLFSAMLVDKKSLNVYFFKYLQVCGSSANKIYRRLQLFIF